MLDDKQARERWGLNDGDTFHARMAHDDLIRGLRAFETDNDLAQFAKDDLQRAAVRLHNLLRSIGAT